MKLPEYADEVESGELETADDENEADGNDDEVVVDVPADNDEVAGEGGGWESKSIME